MQNCPCGSGVVEVACCGMFQGGVPAPTALALMRSRYTAFVRGAIDYLIDTHDPATRGGVNRQSIAQWSRETTWKGLEIVATERGGEDDDDGIVEFIARGVTAGKPFAQRERSRFRREGVTASVVDGLQRSIQSRDLVFEKDRPAVVDGRTSQATYVVNRAELASRVAAFIPLTHAR